MIDLMIILVLLLVIGGAVAYIAKAKKSGIKCIGCPASGQCTGYCNGAHGDGRSYNSEGDCNFQKERE